MMQIYVDAIVASIKTKETQYVLYHSLEYERTSDKNRVLNLLQSGWKRACSPQRCQQRTKALFCRLCQAPQCAFAASRKAFRFCP